MKKPKESKTAAAGHKQGGRVLLMPSEPGKTPEAQVAGLAAHGIAPLASVLATYSEDTYGDDVSLTESYREIERLSRAASGGDLAHIERLLGAQVLTLNAVFAGLAHRSKSNSRAGYLGAADTYMRLALRAQAQCRQTAQTLFEMKNPRPVAFVQQANISNGPQQVNNGVASATATPAAPAHASENSEAPNELLESTNGEGLDFGATRAASSANPVLAAMGELDGATN